MSHQAKPDAYSDRSVMRTLLLLLLTLAYPLLVYFGLGRLEPRWLALGLLGLALGRALLSREKVWLIAAAGALLLAAVSIFGNQVLPLKLYPVLVNLVLLGVFASSLRYPPSMVERLARMREPDLPEAAITYTRQVTRVWCVFFIFNGAMALFTSLYGSDEVWALYNGLIAYVLMGLLMAAEWWVRRGVRARASGV